MPKGSKDHEIVATHIVHAPRERVWAALIDPRHVGEWFGPDGFTTLTQEMDVRPGGVWRHVMRGPDGTEYPNTVTYTKVVPPERIAYTNAGTAELAAFHTLITLRPEGRKTRVSFTMDFASPEELAKQKAIGAVEGVEQTLARLAAYVGKRP